MKILFISLLFIGVMSCAVTNYGKKIECGIGVKNEGNQDTRAISVHTCHGKISYGGVSPGRFKLMIDGYVLKPGQNYPPIKIEYGLMRDFDSVKTYFIDWVKPPQEVLGGPYPPKMMIYIYPGIEGKKPIIVWKRVDQIS